MNKDKIVKFRLKRIIGFCIIVAISLCICLFLVPKDNKDVLADSKIFEKEIYYTSQPNRAELAIKQTNDTQTCYFYKEEISSQTTGQNNTQDTTSTSNSVLKLVCSKEISSNSSMLCFDESNAWTEGVENRYYYVTAPTNSTLPATINYDEKQGGYYLPDDVQGVDNSTVNMLTIMYYTEAPKITVKQNIDTWAKETIKFEFTVDGNCPIKKETVQVNANGSALKTEVTPVEGTNTYEAIITGNKEYQGPVTIMAANMAGMYSQAYYQIKFDNSTHVCNAFKIENIDNIQHSVKDGDKVKASFSLSDQGSGINADSVKVYYGDNEDQYVVAQQVNNNDFTCELTVGDQLLGVDNTHLNVKKIECSDNVGNVASIKPVVNSSIVYYSSIEITKLNLTTDNESGNCVNNSSTVYISFCSNHKVTPVCYGWFGSTEQNPKHIAWDVKDNSEGGYFYQGSYVINETDAPKQQLSFSLYMTDETGNKTDLYTENDFNNTITYFPPIDNCVENVSMELDTERDQKVYAINDDKIKLVLRKDESVLVKSINIAGKELQKDENDAYVYQINEGELTDNSEIEADIVLTNPAGEIYTVQKEKIVGDITYLAPIETKAVSMETSNKIENVVKDDDTLTVSFSTQHEIEKPVGKIAGVEADFVSENNVDWKGKIVVPKNKLKDNEAINFAFDITDIAGQQHNLISGSFMRQINYVAPIKVSDIVYGSNNQKEGSKYVKIGDQIYYSFITNHDVIVHNAKIESKNGSVTKENLENGAKKITVSYEIKYNDFSDLQKICFNASMTDAAGNDIVDISSKDIGNNIIYYAPLTCETSIKADNENTKFAKNTSNIILKCKPSHDAHVVKASVMGRDATFNGSESRNLKIEYLIPAETRNIADGNIEFNYSIADAAGNTLDVNSVSDNSNVIYDNTMPVVDVTPIFDGHSNDGVKFRFSFNDKNIVPSLIKLFVNDKLVSMDDAKIDLAKGVVEKVLVLDKEGNYSIKADVKDMAGNSIKSMSYNFTIDKTNPEITAVKMSSENIKSYNMKMRLCDMFNISEEILDNVICTITDSQGTYEWDLSKPFDLEGKKTLNLLVKDIDGKVSQKFTYEFIVDGSAPNIVTSNNDMNLSDTDDNSFKKIPTSIQISLTQDDANVAEEKDKFTKLCIMNDKKEVICDLLKNDEKLKDSYSYSFINYGKYYIEVEATDCVGNITNLNYKLNIDKPINYVLIFSIIGAVVVLIGGLIILCVKLKSKNKAIKIPR